MPLLEIRDLIRSFAGPDGGVRTIVDVPSYALEAGEHAALIGRSGTGKTTLLHLIAGILAPDAGEVTLDGTVLSRLPEAARDRFRAEKIGYIFQSFNLLAGYSALENILLGMSFGPRAPDRAFATALLERVGLAGHLDHRPRQLSTGQQQRVAVARALANRPRLVLADEPTGNLDPETGHQVLSLIEEVCREQGAALLLVTHDRSLLPGFGRVDDLAQLNRASQPRGTP